MRIQLLIAGLIFFQSATSAQTFPIGQLELDGDVRNLQLKGLTDPLQSFTVRPTYFNRKLNLLNLIDSANKIEFKKINFNKSGDGLTLLPAILTTKFNSHHPYGWNDETMIAAKGLQTRVSAGIYAQWGPLSVQLRPEYMYAANPEFEHNVGFGAPTNGSMSKLSLGQSSVNLSAGPISFGLSTQNLWFGPGQYSALLLSNSAPGFEHFNLHTNRPVKTPIGSFEFQIIGGRLNEDSADGGLYENFFLKPQNFSNDSRYLNAMVLTYQPRFLKGFFIGFTRAFQLYEKDFVLQDNSIIQKYLPVLTSIFKDATNDEDTKMRDQQLSMLLRWLLPKAHTEFYFEYGYNDHKANARDFVVDPIHAAAYIVGAKKLVPLAKKNTWLEFTTEITQMAQSNIYVLRNSGNWYVHGQISQGMTNGRQILGAGSGFGNNVQTFTLAKLDGIKKLGIKIQRIQQDPKGTVYDASLGLGGLNNLYLRDYQWNDFSVGVMARWKFKKIIASAELQQVFSTNYSWLNNNNRTNFYGLLNIAYLW